MNSISLKIKENIENIGFMFVSFDFRRPWGGFLVIDENQAQDFSKVWMLIRLKSVVN